MSGVSANSPAGARFISELKARFEAERSGRPFLVLRDSDDRQRLVSLEPGSASMSIGRRPPADLVLDWDDQVSRLHARLEPVEDHWELVDDGLSRNGTFVNEQRLSGRCRLSDGDTLRLGTTTLTFRSPQPGPPGPADAAEPPVAVPLSTTQRRVLVELCRPYTDRGASAGPATDEQIADELVLSVGEVRTHLRVLYAKLGIEELPRSVKRVRLAERAFSAGLISERDF
jgi:hypothetical protein